MNDVASVSRDPRATRRSGIGLRLLAAQAVVLGTAIATAWIVAAVVGPPLFREHLHQAGAPMNSAELLHAEEAYGYATAISVGGALAVSALVALGVSWYLSRRVQRSVEEVASAAGAVADGHYETRVSPTRLGEEFDALAAAFNQMAARLQSIEATRHRLFGDLAHEIRTPVSVLEAYIEALEDGVRTLSPETAAMLRDQTRRLVRFSEDFAALARAEETSASIARSWIDVEHLVRGCVSAAHERFDAKNVTLETSLPAGLPLLWGDEQRLGQVLGNLLDNALRHTLSGDCVQIGCRRDGDRLTLTVADTGEGIAAEHLPRLFERFYRVDSARDREHGGAGIGLAIAKALVDGHGGHIYADSAGPGMGSTFTVTLPLPPIVTSRPASGASS
ncbi:sensor histidine kinase [Mycolicibacterium hippocampi]|uniref:histidine kinase n=1 Tax=Mycolicibacterium hippocampi TaxID=659824 RepID=A0A7I9ZHK1_9MYCO|nr:ATP-binding protein [Mycolicibacterium hippocampi]GFH00303.1 putative sensor histidine kinase [Mycolicibacterium hippocampi]